MSYWSRLKKRVTSFIIILIKTVVSSISWTKVETIGSITLSLSLWDTCMHTCLLRVDFFVQLCGRVNVGNYTFQDLGISRLHYVSFIIVWSSSYGFWLYSYDIQSGVHDPYEDCLSVMRLYKRMRGQEHQGGGIETSNVSYHTQSFISVFDSCRPKELVKMTPDELLEISKSNYRCWCLDLRQAPQENVNGWASWWGSLLFIRTSFRDNYIVVRKHILIYGRRDVLGVWIRGK